jgi:hypothetical protein
MYNIIMAEEKPTAAFVLSLIGGIFILLHAIAVLIFVGVIGSAFSVVPIFGMIGGLLMIFGIVGLIFAILVIIGAVMINSGDPQRVRTGGILVLIFSILSLFTAGGGFFIGFILGLVGGILALVWKPSKAPVTQEATAPPPPS